MEKFRYTDDSDRAYGAAGMAIGLVVYDGDEVLYSIDLDAAPGDMLTLSPDFFFAGNPRVSAKSAWTQMVSNYNLGIAMLISNVMCRHMVHASAEVPDELAAELRTIAHDEGAGACALEEDEVDRIFEKCYNYLWRVFSHRGVQAVAHDFASTLISRRSLSRLDVLEQLHALSML
ncbi:MAG: hypothetical protein K2K77_07535 [Duncaniella sp.]|nr:hypothetical protein [Duncaniella sp.]